MVVHDTSTTQASADAPPPETVRAQTGYLPMLDALRGVGMFAVLIAHLGFASNIRANFIPGSWFAVSMFFTLSGFLICRQILTGWESDGKVDLRAFWRRRANRLFPAAFLAIAAVMGCSVAGWIPVAPGFRHEVIATIFYGNNWYRIRVLTNGGPFSQFWSLAIEEQFYLFFPLVFLLFRRYLPRHSGYLFGALTVVGFLVTMIVSRRDAIIFVYISTQARLGEILAGVTLAHIVLSKRYLALLHEKWFLTASQIAGVVGVVAYVLLWGNVSQYDAASYAWPLWIHTLATGGFISCAVVDGPVTRLLSIRPLRWLGRLSYSAYVYHALIYLLMTPKRLGLENDLQLAIVRITTTIVVAWLSTRYVEQRFRQMRTTRHARLAIGWGSVALGLSLAAMFLPFQRPTYPPHLTKLGSGGFAEFDRTAKSDSFRFVVVGDQLAEASLPGLHDAVDSTRGIYWIAAHAIEDCPLGGIGTLALAGHAQPSNATCLQYSFLADAVARGDHANQYVVQGGIANLADRLGSDGRWSHPGQSSFDKAERTRLDVLARRLTREPSERVDWYLLDPDDAIAEFRAAERRAAANPDPGPVVVPPPTPPKSSGRGASTTTTTPPRVTPDPAPGSPSDAELRRRVAAFNTLVEQVAEQHSSIHLHRFAGSLDANDWRRILPE